MDEKIICATTDSIERLSLSVRVHNALKRAKIWDVGEVMVLSDDQLFAVRNLGEKGVAEIRERLSKVELLDQPSSTHENESMKERSVKPQILIDLGPPKVLRYEVVEWLQLMLNRQIEAGTLHPQLRIDGYSLAELVAIQSHTVGLYEVLLRVLTAPNSVAQELEHFYSILPPREMDILLRRIGFKRQSLQAIASFLGVTRERVRQLERKAWKRLQPRASTLPLVRIRSALLSAHDLDLSFNDWSNRLLNTGLLGDWSRERFSHLDKIELVIVVCKLLEVTAEEFEIPEALKNIVKLHNDGMSDAPARMLNLLNRYTGEAERHVRRHLRYSGAVSLDWLVARDEIDFRNSDLRLILESKGYQGLDENWYMSLKYVPGILEKDSVLHRSLLKMFQYCGPLDIRSIYFGIEHTLSKTDFPVPPINVLEQLLSEYGYHNESDSWYWNGEMSEELNSGEMAIWDTINRADGVAHHFELMQSIIASGLSGATLGATFARSPLFERFEAGLYIIRGSRPEFETVLRARRAAERIPVELTIDRDTFGNITIGANLGILVVANGTLLSESLPNLSGTWSCNWGKENRTELRVTHNEIRGLLSILRSLKCDVGDRIEIRFNVLNRSATILKVGA